MTCVHCESSSSVKSSGSKNRRPSSCLGVRRSMSNAGLAGWGDANMLLPGSTAGIEGVQGGFVERVGHCHERVVELVRVWCDQILSGSIMILIYDGTPKIQKRDAKEKNLGGVVVAWFFCFSRTKNGEQRHPHTGEPQQDQNAGRRNLQLQ